MTAVRIASVGVAYPPYWITQADAARRIGEACRDPRRVAAIAKGTQIERRALALAPDDIGRLGSIEARNHVYQQLAPALAIAATRNALAASTEVASIGQVVASSCTGYMVPGWDVQLVQDLGLSPNIVRLPLTESGCAGGLVALARTADFVRLHPGSQALAVAAELCSLAFQPLTEAGNLTAALIFGDGAGAALVESGDASTDGLEIVDSLSTLVPCSRDALGFALTDRGFYPILTRELTDLLPGPTLEAARALLAQHGLDLNDVASWLVHTGGARILSSLEERLRLEAGAMRWSWRSLRECGNMSSASIFDVLRRYLDDDTAPRGWGVVIAFGPGVSIEMLLVHHPVIRTLVCGYVTAARLLELLYSRRNLQEHAGSREGDWSRRSFPLIVALHTTVIGATLLFGAKQPRWRWLALLLAVQPLRWWVLKTLGDRWNARGAVDAATQVATTGPYAYVRHPNYSVVAIELASLPAAFRLDRLAVAAALANAALLSLRIRDEEALLFQLPGYEEHFAAKPRFLPFLI